MGERLPRQSMRKALRLLLLLAFVFLSLLILLLLLQLTESALNIWQLLDQLSPIMLVFYAMGLLGFSLLVVVASWMLIRPRKPSAGQPRGEALPTVDRAALEAAVSKAEASGIEAAEARRELAELDNRSAETVRYVVFFGAVSAGKSALIRAITGESGIEVDPRAGTTRDITHYRFSDGAVADLMLTDAPGILDMDKARVRIAREEARRADLVIYVCEGELTRDEHAEVKELLRFERPMIVALNKQDRYSEADLHAIMLRLGDQLPGVNVVPVQAGGQERVVRVDTQGRETVSVRERKPSIETLMTEIAARLAADVELLTRQRDESLMRLGAEKLDHATRDHRRQRSETLVRQYARKAMVGAMAAVSPGTDILIQGYLGTQMVRELTRLYEVSVQQAELERFIELASQHLGKRLTLLLALTGNILKAFPGIGTVTGGLLHAVAYGMIFEGLGKAVAKTLQEDGALESRRALDYFEETISGNLEGRAKHFARLALEEFAAKK